MFLGNFQIQINDEINNIPHKSNNEKNNKKKEKQKKRIRTDEKNDINNNEKITSFIIKLKTNSTGKKKNKYFPQEI